MKQPNVAGAIMANFTTDQTFTKEESMEIMSQEYLHGALHSSYLQAIRRSAHKETLKALYYGIALKNYF